MLRAALAVVHYKLGRLEEAQDLYARAYDIQVRRRQTTANKQHPSLSSLHAKPYKLALVVMQFISCARCHSWVPTTRMWRQPWPTQPACSRPCPNSPRPRLSIGRCLPCLTPARFMQSALPGDACLPVAKAVLLLEQAVARRQQLLTLKVIFTFI